VETFLFWQGGFDRTSFGATVRAWICSADRIESKKLIKHDVSMRVQLTPVADSIHYGFSQIARSIK